MEATVASPVPPAQSNALSAQETLNKNTASQPPPREIIAVTQESLQRTVAATSTDVTADTEHNAVIARSNIVAAAQNSLDKAIAASQPLHIAEILQKATIINHSPKPIELTEVTTVKSSALPMQTRNIEVAQDAVSVPFAQNSTEIPLNKYIPQQATGNNRIVTPQGTWQNVAAPSVPQHTLPAVQNFLMMAFETVQRSNQMGTNNTVQNLANQRPPLLTTTATQNPMPVAFVTTPMSPQTSLPGPIINQQRPLLVTPVVKNPMPVPFVTTPMSPQTSLPAPFPSLQRMNSLPNPIQDTPKLQNPLPDKTPFQSKQTVTSPQASTSLEQTSSTNEIRKAPTSQFGAISKSQSFPGYTFYNTTLQNSTSTLSPPKRSVLVAKRQNPTAKSEPETENSVQNPTPEVLANPVVKPQNSLPEKRNTGHNAKGSPVKQNSSRVAQTFRDFRGRNGPQTSQPIRIRGSHKTQFSAGGSNRNWRQPKANEDDVEEIDPKIRVLVSGFPAYTQAQDIIRVMSRFGKCTVDSCRNRLAVVKFETEKEAKFAMKATNEINIYGEFIEIKPYTNPKHVDDLYKAFKKVIATQKEGPDITMPKEIDLTGDFFQQLENIQNAIRLTREQAQAVINLYGDLEMVLQQEWPGCVAIPFGSIPTGLGIKSSDADCYVELPEEHRARNAAGGGAATFVTRARRLLQQYPNVFTHLLAIPRANTPIVKFRHVPSGFHCDVSAKTPLGAQNSKLIKLLLEHDERSAPIAVLIKYWAKVHELSGTGKLTNYALTMMVIFYLQQPAVGLVPAVERLQRDPATRYIVDHWNAGFSSRKLPGTPNPASIPELLGGFFEFYSGYDFEKLVVCPYLGVPVPKAAFENPHTLPLEFSRYVGNVRDNLASPIRSSTAFCVQDPFEQSHNVASSVCPKLSAEIRAYIKLAADTYTADRPNGCRNFIRTILLTKPKLRNDKMSPTTNVTLIPRVRGQIVDENWRAVVRDIILDVIFKKMLKLHLQRGENDEKKERGRRKVERERYSTTIDKPVWRRRKPIRLQTMHCETPDRLIAHHSAIAEEIFSAGKLPTPLQLEIDLWFRDEPRNCSLSFKMTEGDIDSFRQFVNFLHTIIYDWFRVLLTPHLTNAKEDTQSNAEEKKDVKVECTIKFEREPARPPSPPRLVLDHTDITRELNAVSLDTDTDSSDSSKKEPR